MQRGRCWKYDRSTGGPAMPKRKREKGHRKVKKARVRKSKARAIPESDSILALRGLGSLSSGSTFVTTPRLLGFASFGTDRPASNPGRSEAFTELSAMLYS